jgi:hypothetical protein
MNPIPVKAKLIIMSALFLTIVLACTETDLPRPKRVSSEPESIVEPTPTPKIISRPYQLDIFTTTTESNIIPRGSTQQLSKTIVHIVATKLATRGSPTDLRIDNIPMEIVDSTTGVLIDNDNNLILCDFASVNLFDRSANKRYDGLYVITNRNPREPKVEYKAVLHTANIEKDLAILKFSTSEDESLPVLPQADISAIAPRQTNHTIRILGFAGAPLEPSIHIEVSMVDLMNKNLESISLLDPVSDTGDDKFAEFIKLSKAPEPLTSGILFSDRGTLIGILTATNQYHGPTPILGKTIDAITVAFAGKATLTGLDEPYRKHFPADTDTEQSDPSVSVPIFSSIQKLNPAGRQLAGIGKHFVTAEEIHYEYLVSGLNQPVELSEVWLYEGQPVARLSQSLLVQPGADIWHGGSLAASRVIDALDLVPTEVTTNRSLLLPEGIWQLLISVDGIQRTAGSFTISSEIPDKSEAIEKDDSSTTDSPAVDGFTWGTEVDSEGMVIEALNADSEKILLGFNYNGFENGNIFGWRVYYGPELVYSSKEIPWVFGEAGVFWIGYIPEQPIGAGWWEFEIYVNGEIITQTGRTVQVPE